MDQGSPAPPPPLADEALGAVIQLAQAASRHDGESGPGERHPGAKGRGNELGDNGRATKHVRMDNENHVDAQALAWPPPAYGHNLDQSGMPLPHGDASAFDASQGVTSSYGDTNDRMAPTVASPSDQKHLTSESTGLVGARGKTGMTRTLSTSRRAEQNRNAQRVFRERKNKYIADLESKAASLENALLAAEEHRRRFNEALETIEILKRDNDTLRVALRALGGHQAVPSAPALPIDRPPHAQLLQTTFGQQHPGSAPGRPEAHDPGHAQVQGQGSMHEGDHGQDPATAAAVAAAASGGAPYWLLEAVSNANPQHGFSVSGHFPSQLGDGSMSGSHQMHSDPNAMRARNAQLPPQRPESMLDPSLEHAALGDTNRPQGDERKDLDGSGNPDNLASLSAVAAAAAAASSQKVST